MDSRCWEEVDGSPGRVPRREWTRRQSGARLLTLEPCCLALELDTWPGFS